MFTSFLWVRKMGEKKLIYELFSRERIKDLYEIKQITDDLFYARCKICDFLVTGSSQKEVERRISLHLGSHYAHRKIILD